MWKDWLLTYWIFLAITIESRHSQQMTVEMWFECHLQRVHLQYILTSDWHICRVAESYLASSVKILIYSTSIVTSSIWWLPSNLMSWSESVCSLPTSQMERVDSAWLNPTIYSLRLMNPKAFVHCVQVKVLNLSVSGSGYRSGLGLDLRLSGLSLNLSLSLSLSLNWKMEIKFKSKLQICW